MIKNQAKVFNIDFNQPFLEVLAANILNGTIIPALNPGKQLQDNPACLAELTIYLPTRRAVGELKNCFIRQSGRKSIILPVIKPLAVVNDDYSIDDRNDSDNGNDKPEGRRIISSLQSRQILAKLITTWLETTGRQQRLWLPTTARDILGLADALLNLIYTLRIEEIPLTDLDKTVPDELADHWRISADFLKIISEFWPAYLSENKFIDSAMAMIMDLDAASKKLTSAPVIAAGSTGTIAATARLLTNIAKATNGAVVLPGLDLNIDNDHWQAIDHNKNDNLAAWSHPQSALKRLIEQIGVTREEVVSLNTPVTNGKTNKPGLSDCDEKNDKLEILGEIMRPATLTDAWAKLQSQWPTTRKNKATASVSLLEADTEAEESKAIALMLRQALAQMTTQATTQGDDHKITAAVITSNRSLARRITNDLNRWQIKIHDSAGTPLLRSCEAVLAHSMANCVLNQTQAPNWLALLNRLPLLNQPHFNQDTKSKAIKAIELTFLRMPWATITVTDLLTKVKKFIDGAYTPGNGHIYYPQLGRVSDDDKQAMAAMLEQIRHIMAPLLRLEGHRRYPLATIARHHLECFTTCVTEMRDINDNTALKLVWQTLSDIADISDDNHDFSSDTDDNSINIPAREYPGVLAKIFNDITYQQDPGYNYKIQLWGRLEARLQTADLLIIAGMNEGSWPGESHEHPFMSRGMAKAIGLEPAEKFIGLACHDFCQAFAGRQIIITRAKKQNGVPTTASRFIQRLNAFVGDDIVAIMKARAQPYLNWARNIDQPDKISGNKQPQPQPPLRLRPRKLSVSDVEILIRDPYAVYAKHVLRLFPLSPLAPVPDARDRGTILHAILARFTNGFKNNYPKERARWYLNQCGDEIFRLFSEFPELTGLWQRRFNNLIDPYLSWEQSRNHNIKARYSEISGQLSWLAPGGKFTVTARADRVDVTHDNKTIIIDFKTGNPPTDAQITTAMAPQIALEAAIMLNDGFNITDTISKEAIAELAFIHIGSGNNPFVYKPVGVSKGLRPDKLGQDALAMLQNLIAGYDDDKTAYLSRTRPMFIRYEGDYDHLARAQEWSFDIIDQ